MTNPIRNEKSKLAFKGIFIRENIRQAKIIDTMVELEKAIQEMKGAKHETISN